MATQKELDDLQEDLKPLIAAAIARGEDLSSIDDLQRFVERVLQQHGYVLRGDHWVEASN
jgi:hypothetical protein